MPGLFKLFVQAGRVVLIERGEYKDKIAVIADIIDDHRIIVDGPISITGVPRMVINLKSISLTSLLIPIQRGILTPALVRAAEKYGLSEKWAETPTSMKIESARKISEMNDFDRFKARKAHCIIKQKIREEVLRLKAIPIDQFDQADPAIEQLAQ